MTTQLHILYLEDQPYDVELTQALLEGEGFACDILRVETRQEFAAALESGTWDLIFSDKPLPEFDGLSALVLARQHRPEVPFIFISGTLGEEVAIESLRNGATDYVLKQRLKRLVPVTRRALREAAERRERQAAQAALAASAWHFRALIEHSLDGIVLFNADGMLIFASASTRRILGYAPEDLVGRTMLDLVHPDDLPALAGLLSQLMLHVGGSASTEYRMRHQDGSWRQIESMTNNLLDEPAVQALVVNYRDITERKQAEAALHMQAAQQATVAMLGQRALAVPTLDDLLAEAAQLAVAGLDADYSALSELTPDGQSLVLRSVYGWPAAMAGEVRVALDHTTQAGATFLANRPLILDEHHPQADFGISSYVRERRVISAISVVVPGPDRPFGTLVVHSTRRRTFTEHDTQFLQSVANVLAAALERERNLAVRAERDAADLANQAKSEFLSRMSHELRTPLHAILGFGQLLEMADLSTRQQESVAHIQTAGQHLLMLINEVLDISRIEAGRMALSTEPVLLRDVLEESLILVRPSAADRQISLVTPDLATATACVLADHQRLKQVLLNLLSNAIKYNRFGGRVEIAWETGGVEQLHLTVRDTGRGIPADFLPRLFTPFERAVEQAEVEGTGLGLALSQRLMTAMAGGLGLESTSTTGSTFGLDIPLATPPASLPRSPLPRIWPPAPMSPSPGRSGRCWSLTITRRTCDWSNVFWNYAPASRSWRRSGGGMGWSWPALTSPT